MSGRWKSNVIQDIEGFFRLHRTSDKLRDAFAAADPTRRKEIVYAGVISAKFPRLRPATPDANIKSSTASTVKNKHKPWIIVKTVRRT